MLKASMKKILQMFFKTTDTGFLYSAFFQKSLISLDFSSVRLSVTLFALEIKNGASYRALISFKRRAMYSSFALFTNSSKDY